MAGVEGPICFRVDRAEFNYAAWFQAPLFDLIGSQRFLPALLRSFTPYGLRLGDIKHDGVSSNPGDLQVSCYMLARGLMARFKLEQVQLMSDRLGAFERGELAAAVEAAVRAVRESVNELAIASHALSAGLHGRLEQGVLQARLGALVPTTLGKGSVLAPSGVSFARRWPDGQGEESVVFERSLTLEEGGFLKVTTVYPGTLSESKAFERAAAFFDEAAEELRLEIDWGQ